MLRPDDGFVTFATGRVDRLGYHFPGHNSTVPIPLTGA